MLSPALRKEFHGDILRVVELRRGSLFSTQRGRVRVWRGASHKNLLKIWAGQKSYLEVERRFFSPPGGSGLRRGRSFMVTSLGLSRMQILFIFLHQKPYEFLSCFFSLKEKKRDSELKAERPWQSILVY